ncbi:MAG: hypothetical protein HAW62_06300 [Endozoicomonadaceae bacterium]|nr:hypothetical protein [Endozoicomonadaceae bacterium]
MTINYIANPIAVIADDDEVFVLDISDLPQQPSELCQCLITMMMCSNKAQEKYIFDLAFQLAITQHLFKQTDCIQELRTELADKLNIFSPLYSQKKPGINKLQEINFICLKQLLIAVFDLKSQDAFLTLCNIILPTVCERQYTQETKDFFSDFIGVFIEASNELYGQLFTLQSIQARIQYNFHQDFHIINEVLAGNKKIKDQLKADNLVTIKTIRNDFLSPNEKSSCRLKFLSNHFDELSHIYPISELTIKARSTPKNNFFSSCQLQLDQLNDPENDDNAFVRYALENQDPIIFLFSAIEMNNVNLYKAILNDERLNTDDNIKKY